MGAPAPRHVRRSARLLTLCIGVAATLLAGAAPALADHDGSQLDLVGRSLKEATDAIEQHHEGVDFEIALSPQTQPSGVTGDLLLVVAQQYTPAADDVEPQHFWSLDLGTVVPDLSALDREAATQVLTDSGFEAFPSPAEATDDWFVSGTDPPAGQLVGFNTPVTVLLTNPDSGLVSVPDLTGQTERRTAALLKLAELVIDIKFVDADQAEVGLVVAQDPPAGTQVVPGSKVAVLIGRAVLEQGSVRVPNLATRSEGEARDLLAAAGLVPDVQAVDGDQSAAGRVATQDPPAGTAVTPGSTVTVRVVRLVDGPTGESGEERDEAGSGVPWLPVGLGAALVLGFLAGAAVLGRARRHRAWVRSHVSGRPHGGFASVELVPGAGRSSAVGLVPRSDRGSQHVFEVPR